MSVRSRILKVGAAKSMEMGIIVLIRFFSLPFFLYAWKTELYGEWLILFSLLSYVSLGSLGLAQAAANEMTMSVAKDERDKALVTYHTTTVALLLLSLILMGLALAAAWTLPIGRWLNISLIPQGNIRLILLLFVSYVAIGFMMAILMSGYRCEGKYHRGITYSNVSALAEFGALCLVLLLFRAGPLGVALSMVAIRLFALLVMFIDLKVVVPWLTFGFARAQMSELRRIIWPSLSFLSMPAGQTIINQGVIIGIGAILGPVPVVIFSSLRTLTNLATRIYDLVNQAFYPEVSMAWGAGNKALLQKLHRVSYKVSLWLGILAVAGLAILGPWIYSKWTHGKVPLDMPLFWGFLVLLLLRGLWFTSFVIPAAINKHQRLALIHLIVSALGLGLSLALVNLGLLWALSGFILIEVVMTAIVIRISLRLSEDSLGTFLGAAIPPPNPWGGMLQHRRSL